MVSDAALRVSQDLNSNDDDRGLRPKQGGVVGAAFGFFKALTISSLCGFPRIGMSKSVGCSS